MAYASRSGRARTSATSPQAFGVCDRCGEWWNFVNLSWQYDWRGASIQNLYIKVCPHCRDTPQEQLRAIVLPPDPEPIIQARVEWFVQDETTTMSVAPASTDPVTGIPVYAPVPMATVPGVQMTPEPVGRPVGLLQGAVMPLQVVNGVPMQFGAKLPLVSVTANGTDQIAVTCSAPHGLATNDQISVEGLSNNLADGFYSVTVTTATAFSYQTYSVIAAGGLLTGTTNMVTCLVGLPYGYAQIPQVGP